MRALEEQEMVAEAISKAMAMAIGFLVNGKPHYMYANPLCISGAISLSWNAHLQSLSLSSCYSIFYPLCLHNAYATLYDRVFALPCERYGDLLRKLVSV